MLVQHITCYKGWMIVLRCAQFPCREGGTKFAAIAILKHKYPAQVAAGIRCLRPSVRSIVFPEQAFDTAAEANDDALLQAKQQISTYCEAGSEPPLTV